MERYEIATGKSPRNDTAEGWKKIFSKKVKGATTWRFVALIMLLTKKRRKTMETNETVVKDEAKARVEKELEELNEKIVKLSAFLFGPRANGLSRQMTWAMKEQLGYMQNYAECLQRRLRIWGKTDEEIDGSRIAL